ncbi:MAG: hypothetical protein ACREJ3_12710, partial [Polyangiaceae bacterium]
HPAFYLPGQEVGSGNLRAFPVLAQCSGDGTGCESGVDCCGGYCTAGKCGVPVGKKCSADQDKCTQSSDCCIMTESCIGGSCSYTQPQ